MKKPSANRNLWTKRIALFLTVLFVLLVALLLFLATFSGGPDLPMEITVDGYTIVLGETTMQDLTAQGYTGTPTGVPDTIRSNAKYIPFYYSLDRGAGDCMNVTVMVPWSGETDVSREQERSATEGVVKSVWLNRDALKDVEVRYNGADLQELTFAYAASEWEAEQDWTASNTAWGVDAKRGYVGLAAESDASEEVYELTVQLSEKEFTKMQK